MKGEGKRRGINNQLSKTKEGNQSSTGKIKKEMSALIIRKSNGFFILIRQHDHGLLSGDIAAHWGNANFTKPSHKLVLSTSLHDLSWIETDANLHWNEEENQPYDFTTLPFEARFPIYEKGLDLTEKLNPYGAWLTSRHYCSFFRKEQGKNIEQFLKKERIRQARLKKEFVHESFASDLRHLQLFDNLSLYICLNHPGTPKEQEHPWFKNGIPATTKKEEPVTLHLRWLNERTITVDPYPFAESWSTTLSYSKARKSLGPGDPDIHKTYDQHIRFVAS